MPMEGSRPHDDDMVLLPSALRWQQDIVTASGGPTAAALLDAVRSDVENGGSMATALPPRVRFGALAGLRVMSAVHLLAIDRRAPLVARWLPTLGGTAPVLPADRAVFGRAVVDALTEHPSTLRESLARTPQTNETGRAALLRCALADEGTARPVRLREIGASGGLNLRAERLPGIEGLEAGPLPDIVDRLGCDRHPVDIATPAGRALLSSYVWVDDVERFQRLGAAFRVAVGLPATVVRRDAVAFCEEIVPQDGTVTVLWHSAMWVYLSPRTRQGVLAAVARAGAAAAPGRPMVHVSWELDPSLPGDATFGLVVRRWSGGSADGRPRLLAQGGSHGRDITRRDAPGWLDADPLT